MMITMAHGSGGAETSALIRDIFAARFASRKLDQMEDAAVLSVNGKIAYTTDSYVVTPLFFKGGDIGRLAVCGTCNDLSMMGAKPYALTAGFILEEGLPLETLTRVVDSMAASARKARVKIVAGDTKVIPGNGGMYINTSGIGVISGRVARASSGKDGDAVIVSGNLGDHHACILSSRMEIENDIESDAQILYPLVERLKKSRIPIHGMRDITRGGLATVLHELAHASGLGAELYEESIPVSEAVRGFCDMLGLDPLTMGNEGKMAVIVPQAYAEKAVAVLRGHPAGKAACIAGRLTSKFDGVAMRTRLGGHRHVDCLRGEGLPRIC